MRAKGRSCATEICWGVVCLLAAGALWSVPVHAAPPPEPSWWSQNFEVHGFVRTLYYTRVPDFANNPVPSTLRTEINLEPQLNIFENDDWKIDFYGVFRPVYEAAYDFDPDMYGSNVRGGAFGTGDAYPNNQNSFLSGKGKGFPGRGATIEGEATYLNSDTGTFFTGKLVPALSIDNVVFFGRVTAPVGTHGSQQRAIGGNANGTTYEQLRDNFLVPNGGLPLGAGLDASLGMASQPLSTPLNGYFNTPVGVWDGGLGDKKSLNDSSADINRRESELKFDCFDNAHPYCFAREFYIDATWDNTFVRFGRQQIVWGKTDAFRLQDTINPIDFSYHNVFPSLEERRIPVLALDAIQSLGNVGPLEDVSLEFAWVWDRFIPDQFGQCGEPWAFTASCEARADAGGHQLFNFSLAGVDQHTWKFSHTQPGARIEFRIPEPSISFSLSAFYGYQKIPVAKYENFASVNNPNSAVMLFLQGIGVAGNIDALSEASQGLGAPFGYSGTAGSPGTGVWITGFDPYDRNGPTPTGTLAAANNDLQNAWYMLTNVLDPGSGGCAGVPEGAGLEECGANISIFGLPWSASEAVLKYPRIWSIGGSMDYQIPGIDTILRLEMASDINRAIQTTTPNQIDQVAHRSVFKAAIGLDRSTFIPFINPNRTAFLSFQTFLEYITDYDDGPLPNTGMVPYETQVITTFFAQNYWRNDSLVLTNLFAYDWQAQSVLWGPNFKWVYNSNLFFEFGFNLLWGQNRRHNIRDFCSNGTLDTPSAANGGCTFRNPATWQDGNWQLLNGPLQRASVTPYGWGLSSFADKFMRHRDEFWVGVTYQF